MAQMQPMPPEPGGRATVRCPLCVAYAKALLKSHLYHGRERADRIIARATFKEWTDRAIHLCTFHDWRPRQ